MKQINTGMFLMFVLVVILGIVLFNVLPYPFELIGSLLIGFGGWGAICEVIEW